MKYICFRFDVDTHICLTKATSPILEIFSLHDAKCTFFVSMGRAFSLSCSFNKYISRRRIKPVDKDNHVYSISYKLGFLNSVMALLFNPRIGSANANILRKIVGDGHELGLHGGKNHAIWEIYSGNWNVEETTAQIQYGLTCFEKLNLPKPISFASPCWQSPEMLAEILTDKGFSILADTYSCTGVPEKDEVGLIKFPVNVLPKRATVGFIENLRVLGYSTNEILYEFEKKIDDENLFKMVFDHPLYVGLREREILSKMLGLSIKHGYQIESLKNIYNKFQ